MTENKQLKILYWRSICEEDGSFPSVVTFSFDTNISHRGLKVCFQVVGNFSLPESCVTVCEAEPISDIGEAEKPSFLRPQPLCPPLRTSLGELKNKQTKTSFCFDQTANWTAVTALTRMSTSRHKMAPYQFQPSVAAPGITLHVLRLLQYLQHHPAQVCWRPNGGTLQVWRGILPS